MFLGTPCPNPLLYRWGSWGDVGDEQDNHLLDHSADIGWLLPANQACARKLERGWTHLTWLLPSWSLQLCCMRHASNHFKDQHNERCPCLLWTKTLGALRKDNNWGKVSLRMWPELLQTKGSSCAKRLAHLQNLKEISLNIYGVVSWRRERWG